MCDLLTLTKGASPGHIKFPLPFFFGFREFQFPVPTPSGAPIKFFSLRFPPAHFPVSDFSLEFFARSWLCPTLSPFPAILFVQQPFRGHLCLMLCPSISFQPPDIIHSQELPRFPRQPLLRESSPFFFPIFFNEGASSRT